MPDFAAVVKNFKINGNFLRAEPYGEGHINDTYAAYFEKDGRFFRVILQRINNRIFTDIPALMRNISLVCAHVKNKVIKAGGNPDRECLQLIPALNGADFYCDANGAYWRCYVFIEKATSHQQVTDPLYFYESARAFGRFQRHLKDFDASQLTEPLKDFHNTKERFNNFLKAVEADPLNRAGEVKSDISFAYGRMDYCSKIVDALKNGEIPLKVTHNDTKLNNVMIDDADGKGIAVIDLDTVMPGSALYDFGDSIRFGCNNALEDEADPAKITFNMGLFRIYVKGYLSELSDSLVKPELNNLAFSAIPMTYECGMRFLTDHIAGDVYFKIKKPGHNLIRARNQFKLVAEMEKAQNEMHESVLSIAETRDFNP